MAPNQIAVLGVIASTAVILICLAITYKNNKSFAIKGFLSYSVLLLSFACGNIFHVIQYAARNPEIGILMFQSQIIFAMIAMAAYAIFFWQNLPINLFPIKWNLFWVAVIFVAATLFLLINPINISFDTYLFTTAFPFATVLGIKFGYVYYFHQLALYLYCLLYVARAGARGKGGRKMKKQMLSLFLSVANLMFWNALHLWGVTRPGYTNIFVCVSVMLLTHCVLNFGVIDAVSSVRRNMFELLKDAFAILLLDGTVKYINAAAEQILGAKLADVQGKMLHEINEGFPQALDSNFETVELSDRHTVLWLSFTELTDQKKKHYGNLVLFRDITELEAADRRVRYLAEYDGVTGLLNQSVWIARVNKLKEDSNGSLIGAYVLAMRISNEQMLHEIADNEQMSAIYSHAADHIRKLLPETSLISRFGQNEFCVLIKDAAMHIDGFKKRFHDARQTVFEIDDEMFYATFQAGVYPLLDERVSVKEAAARALFALRNIPANANGLVVYDAGMSSLYELQKELLTSLEYIDYNKEFYLEFQPIVDITHNRISGAEALLRWNHTPYGIIPPSIFIPIFENANMMDRLGHFVLHKACEVLTSWNGAIGDNFRLSVNISKKQLADPNFTNDFTAVFGEDRSIYRYLDFEITETATASDMHSVLSFIQFTKSLGATVSLDDFGSGDTSISYITKLCPNKVKFDISLTENAHTDSQKGIVIKSILDMCSSLNIAVVVEHVETLDVLERLKVQGFSLIQGYIFSRPMSPSRFMAYYNSFEENLR